MLLMQSSRFKSTKMDTLDQYLISSIAPTLHIHLRSHVALSRTANGQRLGTFQEAVFFRKPDSIG